jgi:hypothetical protein
MDALRRWQTQPAFTRSVQIAAFLLAVWGATCGESAGITAFTALPGENDIEVQATVLKRVQAGESYYAAVVDELHRRGYPTSSPFNFRLPSLVWFLAALPSLRTGVFLLLVLGTLTAVLWGRHFVQAAWPRALWLAIPLSLTMCPIWLNVTAVHLNDLWTGQFIALSLAAWAGGMLPLSLAAGAAAALIRELAWPYLAVMAIAALVAGHRREALGWTVAAGVALLAFAAHVYATIGLGPPDALRSGWVAGGGWCFALRTARMNALLMLLPTWLHAGLVSFAVAGAWMWRAAPGRRLAAILTMYVAVFLVVGRPDNFYWGLLIAPILPLGVMGWSRRF